MNVTSRDFRLIKVLPILLITILSILLCQGCHSQASPTPSTDQTRTIKITPSPVHIFTIAAYETQIASLTLTSEFNPMPTVTSTTTVTPIPPTKEPTLRITPTLRNCNWAEFVRDVTIPDGTEIKGGDSFSKTWRLKNIGDCPWTRDYEFVFVGGESFNAPNRIGMPTFVGPGEMVDITIVFEAPTYPGSYRGYFMLANRQGERFGTGVDADDRLWVDIIVRTPDEKVFDFTKNFCSADWKSSVEGSLPCPGDMTSIETGFVVHQGKPIREDGSVENEPGLVVNPDDTNYGFIYGIYPSITIRKGDLFKSVIGCAYDSPGCDLTFELRSLIQGDAMRTIKSWREIYDGQYHSVTTDLSDLAGYTVNIIIYVENNGDSKNNTGLWIAPRIMR